MKSTKSIVKEFKPGELVFVSKYICNLWHWENINPNKPYKIIRKVERQNGAIYYNLANQYFDFSPRYLKKVIPEYIMLEATIKNYVQYLR